MPSMSMSKGGIVAEIDKELTDHSVADIEHHFAA
jgi:protein required for attachment to host cells